MGPKPLLRLAQQGMPRWRLSSLRPAVGGVGGATPLRKEALGRLQGMSSR